MEKWFLSAQYKLSKAKEFLGLGFSKETSEILGNLGLKPKLDGFRSTAEVSTAMYKLLEKIGFTKVEGLYLAKGTYTTNYIEFMKIYNSTGDKVASALGTPAGKALNKVFKDAFVPEEINIVEGVKVEIKWKKRK